MKSSPIKSVTVNIVPKYGTEFISDNEWNQIWLDWHYEVQSRIEREKLEAQKNRKVLLNEESGVCLQNA